jgi:hypothetical protein
MNVERGDMNVGEVEMNVANPLNENKVNKKPRKYKTKYKRPWQSVIDAETGKNIKVTVCTHLGFSGVALLLLQFAYSGFYFYLMYEYSFYFKNMNRNAIWILFLFGLSFLLMSTYFLLRWKKMASKDYFINGGKKRKRSKLPLIMRYIVAARYKTAINGPYFIYKLYGFEILESINQIINLVEIYTCSLPTEVTASLCIVFFIDSTYRAYTMQNIPFTPQVRDRIVVVDIIIDLVCIGMPLFFMWVQYAVPITANSMFLIVLWPSFCSLLKLRSLFRQEIRRKTHAQVIVNQAVTSVRHMRNRESLFGEDKLEQLTAKQKTNVPNYVHNIYSAYFSFYGLFMLLVAIVQLIRLDGVDCRVHDKGLLETDNMKLWNACKVKTPFCNNVFMPHCNCAILKLKRHNYTKLPQLFERMNALKGIVITHGPLKSLPIDIGRVMSNLAWLEVDFNELQTLPASLGSAKHLAILYASDNNISNIPLSIWQHSELRYLDLSKNKIKSIPENMNIEMIALLLLENNALSRLPQNISNHYFLHLISLSGNKLTKLPLTFGDGALKKSLGELKLARNNLTSASFPQSFQNLDRLVILDLRNNSLHTLPSAFDKMQSLKDLAVWGNPICRYGCQSCSSKVQTLLDKEGLGCTKQCSDICLNSDIATPGCVISCNVSSCDYSNGECLTASFD